MQLDLNVNGSNLTNNNETGLTLQPNHNSISIFYKLVNDENVDGSQITYNVFVKHKSSDFRSPLKDNDGVDFPTTVLDTISASSTSNGYFTMNFNSGYSLASGEEYVFQFITDSSAGVTELEIWTQTASISINNVNLV